MLTSRVPVWLNVPYRGVEDALLAAAAAAPRFSRVSASKASADRLLSFGGCLFEDVVKDGAQNARGMRVCMIL